MYTCKQIQNPNSWHFPLKKVLGGSYRDDLFVLEEFVPEFPLDADQVTNVVYMLVAYIVGVAIDDAGQGIGGNPPF